MESNQLRIAYCRDIPGCAVSRQIALAKSRGIDDQHIWVEGRESGENLDTMLRIAIRRGMVIEVAETAVLAAPKRHKGDELPRKKLKAVADRIMAAGASVYEIESGRSCKNPHDMLHMFFEAVDRLAGQKNAKRGPGRPKWKAPNAERMRAAKAVWLNHRDYETNQDALDAINADPDTFGGPWNITRLHREFGKSERQFKGRRPRGETS